MEDVRSSRDDGGRDGESQARPQSRHRHHHHHHHHHHRHYQNHHQDQQQPRRPNKHRTSTSSLREGGPPYLDEGDVRNGHSAQHDDDDDHRYDVADDPTIPPPPPPPGTANVLQQQDMWMQRRVSLPAKSSTLPPFSTTASATQTAKRAKSPPPSSVPNGHLLHHHHHQHGERGEERLLLSATGVRANSQPHPHRYLHYYPKRESMLYVSASIDETRTSNEGSEREAEKEDRPTSSGCIAGMFRKKSKPSSPEGPPSSEAHADGPMLQVTASLLEPSPPPSDNSRCLRVEPPQPPSPSTRLLPTDPIYSTPNADCSPCSPLSPAAASPALKPPSGRSSVASLSNHNHRGGSVALDRHESLGVKDYSVRLAPVIRQSFATYCQETTLHGWKYVTSGSSTVCEKSTWLLLLLVSLTTASVLVYRAVGDFMAHTVSTNMESLSTTFNNIYFPAITICNMNFMQRSVLQKYKIEDSDFHIEVFDRMINVGSEHSFTEEEIRMYHEVERKANGSNRLKMEAHPKCNTMFLSLMWKNKNIPIKDPNIAMHYQQTTDESVCCQIFPGMLQAENHNEFDINDMDFWVNHTHPWRYIFDGYKTGVKPGKQGVQVLIDVETFEYFSVHSAGSEGVLVLVQHYRDIPLMRKESFVLAPGFEVDVGLSITEITTTEGAITRFSPEERDCYTEDEVDLVSLPLKKGYRMSMNNCLYDKALHATKEECGCIPPFYTLGALGRHPTCKGTNLYCAYKIFDDVVQASREAGTAGTCRAPCNDQIYQSRIAFASYPNRALFPKRQEVCFLVIKLDKICTGWLDPDAIPAYGQYPDEYKIKKNVLLSHFPQICDRLANFSEGANFNFSQAENDDTCLQVRRRLTSHPDLAQDLYEYAKRNLLWLNVYVKDSFATHIVRDEKMTRTSFVANVGGLLGLCMGFSLVSVAEILYYMFKRQTLHACRKGLRQKALSRKKSRLKRTGGGGGNGSGGLVAKDAAAAIAATVNKR